MDALDFVMGIGFAFVLEGLVWSLFPSQILRILEELTEREGQALRYVGLGSLALGVAIIWLVQNSRAGG